VGRKASYVITGRATEGQKLDIIFIVMLSKD
jgi:hypothetical protein